MIVLTIPYCLAENQLPNQSNGVRGPLLLHAEPVDASGLAHLAVSLPHCRQRSAPSLLDDGGMA